MTQPECEGTVAAQRDARATRGHRGEHGVQAGAVRQPHVEGSYVSTGENPAPRTRGTYVTTSSHPTRAGGSYTYTG